MKKTLTAVAIALTLAGPVMAEEKHEVVEAVENTASHVVHAVEHAGKAVTGVIKWTVDLAKEFVGDVKDAFVHD